MALFRVLPDNIDVWLLELARGVSTRFTLNPANDVLPVWSPDGARIIFSSTRKGGVHDLYIKRADGTTEEEPLLSTPQDKVATGWSPDGQSVLFVMYDPKTQNDIWALPMSGSRQPFALVMTPFEERNPQFSPDGKWIAYQSNESGRFEIYIQPFPGPGARTRVSTDGGAQARWRRDGKELFYIALDRRLMAVPLRLPAAGQNIEVGIHAPLMTTHMPVTPEHLDGQQYIVSPDGQRFLINTIAEEGQSPIKLILNWKP
jgi:Tol biopolymer transport system component